MIAWIVIAWLLCFFFCAAWLGYRKGHGDDYIYRSDGGVLWGMVLAAPVTFLIFLAMSIYREGEEAGKKDLG